MDDNKSIVPENDLSSKLMEVQDINEINKIVDIFNMNIQKKNVIRKNKLSDLQDSVLNEMTNRLVMKSGEFNNQDLLNYFKAIQDSLKNDGTSTDVIPQINLNKQEVNINMGTTLNTESRKRVMATINSILNKYNLDESEEIVIDEEREQ